MKFSSTQREIRALLTSGYYRVPRFQRPYSWTRDELEEFWSDTIVEGEADYFIGSIVAFTAGPGVYGIVDGQQRLTTITMLLCCIRDAFEKEGNKDLADGLHTLVIERPNVESLPQYVLQPETSSPYFQEYIQKREVPEVQVEPGEEEVKLKSAHQYLLDQVDAATDSVRSDSTLNDEERAARIKVTLEEMRDKLLDLSLIFVELDDEDDACLVFETLNARGKDLRVSDLVKNHLARHLKKKTKTVDTFKTRWESVVETIEGSIASISVDGFIHHHWLSTNDYTSEKKLFKSIKKVIKKNDAGEYLDGLVRESLFYRSIFDPAAARWTKTEAKIKDSLRALTVFGVRQPAPFVLSLLSELRDKRLKPKHVADALRAVEVFHFQFTAIASQSSSGGISQMYAKHAREVRDAESSEEAVRSIRELKDKLWDRLPGTDEFDAGFLALAYSDNYTRAGKLVRYTLGKLARHGLKTKVLDYDQLTIEHLAPQHGSSVAPDYIGNIGNLVLVDDDLNVKLANKSFKLKKRLLMKATDVWKDDILRQAKAWREAKIGGRAELLAKVAREEVWKI